MRISFHPAGKQIKREVRRDVRFKPSDLGEIKEEREREWDEGARNGPLKVKKTKNAKSSARLVDAEIWLKKQK